MKSSISGTTTGTGSAINIEVGFLPTRIEMQIGESSVAGFWDDSMRAATFNIQHIGESRTGNVLIGSHLPSIGSTDTQLANDRVVCQYIAAGDVRVEKAATTAGTAFTATDHDIDATEWACYQLCVVTGGTVTIERSGGAYGSTSGYATEALAVAALPTVTTNSASLGYITIEATSGAIFNATTDALAAGASGTPAETTNYYAGYGVMTAGISQYGSTSGDSYYGFTIGTSDLLNVAGSIIYWKAFRD